MNDIVTKRQAPALALGENLMRMMADPQISAEKLKLLLDTQKEIIAESRREAFQAAFAQMSPKIPQVDKNGIVELVRDGKSLGRYPFMKYEDMMTVVEPIMHDYGFGLSFSTVVTDGKPMLRGKLMHEAGHFEMSEMPIVADPGPGRNAMQAEGSGMTYQRRRIAELLLNVVRKGVDNDAVGAMTARISPEQVVTLYNLLNDTKTSEKTFLEMMVTEATKLEEIPQRDFARIKNVLELKVQQQAKKAKK